jgi:hypothetical protein
MIKPKDVRALIYLGISLACLLILSISISQLKFLPGVPFSLGNLPPEIAGNGGELSGEGNLVAIIRGLAALATILLAAYIISHLLTPEGRKRLLADVVALALLFLLMNLLAGNLKSPLAATQTPNESQPPEALPTAPIATFTANPPQWVDLIAIVILAVLLTVLFITILRITRRARQKQTTLERIARQAETALDALREGSEPKDVVLRCYYEMSQVVREQQHIQRDQAMTPQEFEQTLLKQGLPGSAVQQLTHLFEQVRYGAEIAGKQEEQTAMDSLSAIIAACRNPLYASRSDKGNYVNGGAG